MLVDKPLFLSYIQALMVLDGNIILKNLQPLYKEHIFRRLNALGFTLSEEIYLSDLLNFLDLNLN